MYIKVKEILVNFDKVCYIKRDSRVHPSVVIFFDYNEGSRLTVNYDSENDAQAAYKALETLLIGKE